MNKIVTIYNIEGIVMYIVFCNLFAPSMVADSYSCFGILAIAARYTIVLHPVSFHMVEPTSILLKYLLSVRKDILSMPSSERRWFAGPSEANKAIIRPEITTHDRKCGI